MEHIRPDRQSGWNLSPAARWWRAAATCLLVFAPGLAGCHPPERGGVRSPPIEDLAPITAADLIGPVGHWAQASDTCGRETWTISDTALLRPDGERCALRAVAAANQGWRAHLDCPQRRAQSVRLETADGAGDHLSLYREGAPRLRLVRCGTPPAHQTYALKAPLRAATAINQLIADQASTMEESRLGAGLHFARIWRRDGAVVKVTAPIGGGPQADRDRSYYFRSGAVFLIEGPSATFAIREGRLATWFSRSGTIISSLVPESVSAMERDLLIDAAAVASAVATPDATQAVPSQPVALRGPALNPESQTLRRIFP